MCVRVDVEFRDLKGSAYVAPWSLFLPFPIKYIASLSGHYPSRLVQPPTLPNTRDQLVDQQFLHCLVIKFSRSYTHTRPYRSRALGSYDTLLISNPVPSFPPSNFSKSPPPTRFFHFSASPLAVMIVIRRTGCPHPTKSSLAPSSP